MRLTAQRLLALIVYSVLLFALPMQDSTSNPSETLTWLVLGIQTIRMILENRRDSLGFAIGITFFALFAFPSIGMIVYEQSPPLEVLGVFILSSDIIKFSAGKKFKDAKRFSISFLPKTRIIFVFLQLWMILSPFVLPGDSLLTLVVPLSISAVLLEAVMRNHPGERFSYFALFSFGVVFAAHLTFHWSGFGRLVVGTYLFFIVVLIMQYVDLGVRTWQFILVLPVALYFAQLSRYGEIENLRTVLMGSAAHHMIVTQDAQAAAERSGGQGWAVYLDQLSLLVLGWFPRAIWEDKPLGAGLFSVDIIYGRQGLPSSYTQSLGFWGEQYFLLGTTAWIGLVFVLIVLVLLRRLIVNLSEGFLTPIVAFDVSLLSFFWGGMAIFGSRVWFLVVPAIVFIFYRRLRFSTKLFN